MKTYLITLLATLAFTGLAYAEGPKDKGPDHHPHPGAGPEQEGCDDLKLTDDQNAALKAEHLKSEDERIDLEAKMKHAHLELEKALANKESDDKTILKAAQAASDAASKLHTAEELNRIEVVLKVFKGEDREKALRCGILHHGPGFGPRPGFGPGHGPEHDEASCAGPHGQPGQPGQPDKKHKPKGEKPPVEPKE